MHAAKNDYSTYVSGYMIAYENIFEADQNVPKPKVSRPVKTNEISI